jgi:hypothetical protein
MNKPLFIDDRKLLIVTKHGKNKVISKYFNKEFGLKSYLSSQFDTDSLGTFTGEISRKDDPITTLRKKCLLGMQQEGFDLAIATEASFGPHPNVFFVPAHEELIMIKDLKNNFEIVEKILTTDTNFASKKVNSIKDIKDFCINISFPKFGVILKFQNENETFFKKDLKSLKKIREVYNSYKFDYQCEIETDMRAMNNPKRMEVISKITKKLIEKILNFCPSCNTPGFGIVSSHSGLKCEICTMPTQSTLYFLQQCTKCKYEEKKMYPNQKTFEDPMYCDYCNP